MPFKRSKKSKILDVPQIGKSFSMLVRQQRKNYFNLPYPVWTTDVRQLLCLRNLLRGSKPLNQRHPRAQVS